MSWKGNPEKRRFLNAIGKAVMSPDIGDPENPELPITECDFSDLLRYSTFKQTVDKVKDLLKNNSKFDLKLYLSCAQAIYLIYERKPGKHWEDWEQEHCKIFTYVLVHARLFGDQSQSMFQFECNANHSSLIFIIAEILQPLPKTEYMNQITVLIKDLKYGYNEMKFRILNANVTYLTLLILRRFVKDEEQFSELFRHTNTQDNYMKLCPHHLGCKLPQISNHFNRNVNDLHELVYLAIYVYTTVEDVLTKTILRETCIQFFEWHDMELPGLFFKVVNLYGMEEARLWDILSCKKASQSLSRMADAYYYTYFNKTKAEESIAKLWFPYCWAMNATISKHLELSGLTNTYLCTILAYIVDKKVGFDKSYIRNSDWVESSTAKKTGLKIANAFYQFHQIK